MGLPVINMKDYSLDWHAGARDFERGLKEGIEADHWQTDTSISNLRDTWSTMFKTPEFIVSADRHCEQEWICC